MASYNVLERWAARTLARFPRAYTSVKRVYQRVNYLAFRDRKVRFELHTRARLLTPMRWAGVEDQRGEWFFGYYDKTPWSADMEHFLLHHPIGDVAEIMVLDRSASRVRTLGKTSSWNFQQGSQAQWLPGPHGPAVVFNDVVNDKLGCRLISLDGTTDRFIPWPIQALHPNGHEALSINYRRVHAAQPEYGYAADVSNFSCDQALDRDGIWRMDLEAATAELVVGLSTLADAGEQPFPPGTVHMVNHLVYSPSGARFVFMHRWFNRHGKSARLYVARHDGGDLRLLAQERTVSHYHWRDNDHLLVWQHASKSGYRYYLIDVVCGDREPVGEGVFDIYGDGHPSYSPDRRWIVTDSYPDRARFRHLLLFDTHSGKRIEVGRFFSPWRYDGGQRCDLHPRWSPDGRWVSIDSTHEGERRSYVVDVEGLVETG
ncbi:MAG: hypothetical protein IID43_05685 [Planctomycetes bacterium]|nr:hypothetical protein [Planctomycetota bacterium]